MRFLDSVSARRDALSLAVVLVIAAFTRLGDLGVVQYRYDEGLLSGISQEIAAGRSLPLLGLHTTTGVPTSPISLYVMAIPYLLSDSALFATASIAVLNVIGTGLLWCLARRFTSPTVALTAGLIYALNPWAILASRKIWTPYFISPFMIAAFLVGLYAFVEGRRWAQVACLPLLLFAAQIHPQGVALLPVYGWLLWIGRKNLSRRSLALSLALGGLTVAPYLVGLLTVSSEESTAIERLVGMEGREFALNTRTIPLIARYATGLGVETYVTAPQQYADLFARAPVPAPLWFVMGGLTLVGVLASWLKYRRIAVVLYLWAALPFTVLTLGLTPLQDHYLVVSLPALSLLAGMAVEWIASLALTHRFMVYRAAIFGVVGVILVSQGLWWRGLVHYLDSTATPGGFGTPLHYMMDVRQRLIQYEDVIIVGGGDRTSSWIWQPMLNRVECVREVVLAEGGIAVFPDNPFAALYPPESISTPLYDLVRQLYQTGESALYPLREGENPYTVFRFESMPEWPGPELTSIDPTQMDNGVMLTGYRVEPDRLYLRWKLPGRDAAWNYQYFGHFLNQRGERIGQRDSSFWPSKYWCEGDTVVTWINIALPQGTATLRVGMYVLERGQIIAANVLDAGGQPVGQWIDIPLTES